MSSINKNIFIQNWGIQDYEKASKKQEKLLQSIISIKKTNRLSNFHKKTPNYLIFLEHNPVYSIGKSGRKENLLIDQ